MRIEETIFYFSIFCLIKVIIIIIIIKNEIGFRWNE